MLLLEGSVLVPSPVAIGCITSGGSASSAASSAAAQGAVAPGSRAGASAGGADGVRSSSLRVLAAPQILTWLPEVFDVLATRCAAADACPVCGGQVHGCGVPTQQLAARLPYAPWISIRQVPGSLPIVGAPPPAMARPVCRFDTQQPVTYTAGRAGARLLVCPAESISGADSDGAGDDSAVMLSQQVMRAAVPGRSTHRA
jgi:hypothetical protein